MELLIERKKVSSALGKSNLPGLDYTLNPYIGCSHGCIYCYARLYSDPRIRDNWGKIVVVKENIVDVLAKEVRRKKKGIVGLSTITDAYQRIEAKEGITREILRILLESNFRTSIQTKSSLVLRDLDLLISKLEIVDVGFTITTLEDSVAKVIEPGASPPSERVEALEKISAEGIKTWIFLGPIIPGVSEESFSEIVEIAKATKSLLYYDKYRTKPFMSGKAKEFAESAKKIDWKVVSDKIERLCRSKGVEIAKAFDDL
ncbi:MAG: radical SAM protein [Archaeoglobi archaeon]|jgi:DNA repair photolyase|nr:radical SAM protein [Archaeoglobi archaeon]TDA25094.1 MAG: radical SAM protein [Archaeoglobi archaeon]